MRARGEADVLLSNGCDLCKTQAGLKSGQQKGVIAAPQPRIAVRSREQRIDLGPGEKADQRTWLPLVGNHQHTLDQPGVLRRLQRSISKE